MTMTRMIKTFMFNVLIFAGSGTTSRQVQYQQHPRGSPTGDQCWPRTDRRDDPQTPQVQGVQQGQQALWRGGLLLQHHQRGLAILLRYHSAHLGGGAQPVRDRAAAASTRGNDPETSPLLLSLPGV